MVENLQIQGCFFSDPTRGLGNLACRFQGNSVFGVSEYLLIPINRYIIDITMLYKQKPSNPANHSTKSISQPLYLKVSRGVVLHA